MTGNDWATWGVGGVASAAWLVFWGRALGGVVADYRAFKARRDQERRGETGGVSWTPRT